MTYSEISRILKKEHSITLSSNAICKRLIRLNYPRRRGQTNCTDADLRAHIQELLTTVPNTVGYRYMTDILKHKGIPVRRDKVMQILRDLDPVGVRFRRRRRIMRKVYYSCGPNFIWHVDGYDKLKPYGFPIHGCIDGYSRKILWLVVGPSNNNPAIVGQHFLNCVRRLQGCPTILQSDPGTENIIMGALQCLFRHEGKDMFTGIDSYRVVRSLFNQRIECWWSMMRRHQMEWWIHFFKDLEVFGAFQRGNLHHIYAIRFSFMPLLQHELNNLVEQWNNHSISYNRHAACPHGKPTVLYLLPEEKGFLNCLQSVNEEDIEFAGTQCKVPSRSGSHDFDEQASLIFIQRGWHDASNWREALAQYFVLRDY
ncbi:uncharacterized protein LOC133190185 [Saccostrea echinata]|uniref:uncharacterized protein LOC133190185 n=1 Tax=Saccostrea echinata TaxID=191078 RepID=UPI002A7F14BB|nr:uncharacterized protein LOC133190185 [Saccostrea echinata]